MLKNGQKFINISPASIFCSAQNFLTRLRFFCDAPHLATLLDAFNDVKKTEFYNLEY